MEFVAAICPQCGGSLQFDQGDQERKETFCKYCGNKVFVKEAIELKELSIKGISSGEELIANGETFINLGEWDKAEKAFQKAIDVGPGDYRGWWGLVKVFTREFTNYEALKHVDKNIHNARSLASDEDLQYINAIYEEFASKAREYFAGQEEVARRREQELFRQKQERIKQGEIQRQREAAAMRSEKRRKNAGTLSLICVILLFLFIMFSSNLCKPFADAEDFGEYIRFFIPVMVFSLITGLISGYFKIRDAAFRVSFSVGLFYGLMGMIWTWSSFVEDSGVLMGILVFIFGLILNSIAALISSLPSLISTAFRLDD